MTSKGESLTAFLNRPYQAFLFGERHDDGEKQLQVYARIVRAAARAKIPHIVIEAPPSDQFAIDQMALSIRFKKLFDEKPPTLMKRLWQSADVTPWADFMGGLAEIYSTGHHTMRTHAVDVVARSYAITLIHELGRDLERKSLPLNMKSMNYHLTHLSDDELQEYRDIFKRPDLTRQGIMDDLKHILQNREILTQGIKERLSDDSATADEIMKRSKGQRLIAFYGERHLLHFKPGSDGPLDIDEALRGKLGNDKVARIHMSGNLDPNFAKKPEFVFGSDFRIHPYEEPFPQAPGKRGPPPKKGFDLRQ